MRELTVLLAFGVGAALAEPPALVVESLTAAGAQASARVRNGAELAATAFVAGSSDTAFASFDSLLGSRNGNALKPGETATVTFSGPAGSDVRVMAAIFEDGTTTGDRRWVRYLLDTREEVREQLPLALAWLQHASSPGVAASTAAFWFRSWQDRWQASNPSGVTLVPQAAEMFLARFGNRPAAEPAHDLIQVFQEISAKLAASKPQL